MADPYRKLHRSSLASGPAASTRAELSSLVDRARDERFRLLKMLKDARVQVPPAPAPGSAPAPGNAPGSGPGSDAAPESSTDEKAADTESAAATLCRLADKLAQLDHALDDKAHRVQEAAAALEARLHALDAQIGQRQQRLEKLQASLLDHLQLIRQPSR